MNTIPFSPRDLRDALSSFATGVTIVTTSDKQGEPVGVTASSFNSVSMEPPLVLWSVGKEAYSAQSFLKASHFSIHVLRSDQIDHSNGFARRGEDKFSGIAYSQSEHGVPHLDEFLTRFECKTWQVYEGGDHWIVVGEVLGIEANKGSGLVFCSGSYSTANPIVPAKSQPTLSDQPDAPVENLLIYNLARANKQLAEKFHDAVRECGLSVAEWRILASLQGEVTRELSDLATRTFVRPDALYDLLTSMQEEGLCLITKNDGAPQITGTTAGHARIEHLFQLGASQELEALGEAGEEGVAELVKLLRQVVKNTN